MPRPSLLLDLVTRTKLIVEYRSLTSSLWSVSPPMLHRPFQAQIFSTAPYSQTPSAFVPPSMWTTKFHTHTKLYFGILIVVFLDSNLINGSPRKTECIITNFVNKLSVLRSKELFTLTFFIRVEAIRDPLCCELPHVQIFMSDRFNPLTWDDKLLSYWFSWNLAVFQD